MSGSADAGATVHADIPALNAMMSRTAKLLNLKPHIVGFNKDNRVILDAVGDLEGHLGFDNRFYLVDFGRTFPCEGPSPEIGISSIFTKKQSLFGRESNGATRIL